MEPARYYVKEAELTSLVQEQVGILTANGSEFSAFEVTLEIRKNNPTLEIEHGRVRPLVRDAVYAIGGYTEEERQYPDGNWARTYFPAPAVVPDVDDEDEEDEAEGNDATVSNSILRMSLGLDLEFELEDSASEDHSPDEDEDEDDSDDDSFGWDDDDDEISFHFDDEDEDEDLDDEDDTVS